MPTKEQQEKQAKRYEPISERNILAVYRVIRDTLGDSELAISVNIQLREYARLMKLERHYFDTVRKPISQLLRETADSLDNY